MADFLDVASALAAAFLAEGSWTRAALTERAALAIGERPSWLPKASARVLAKFQDPPQGRLRELARFVASDRNLRKACRDANPPAIRSWLVPRADTRTPRWKSRPLSTPGDVAQWLGLAAGELDWFADPRGLEREVASEALRHYSYRWVSKRSDGSGGVRLLEAPKSRMKTIQRK